MGTVLDEDRHLHRRVELVEYLPCHLHAGKDTLLLDKEMALAHSVGRNAAKGCVVAVADVLSEGKFQEFVF